MMNRGNRRILTIIKFLYIVISNDRPLLVYVDQLKTCIYMTTSKMPFLFENSSYANVKSTRKFLDAISQNLYLSLIEKIKNSQINLIFIDESTEQICEPHFIMYVCYLRNICFGSTCVQFIELMPLSWRNGKVMFEFIKKILEKHGFDLLKLVAIAKNGAACMTGVHQGVVARLWDLVSSLVGTHYTAYWEALIAKDANDKFSCLGFIDRAANKV